TDNRTFQGDSVKIISGLGSRMAILLAQLVTQRKRSRRNGTASTAMEADAQLTTMGFCFTRGLFFLWSYFDSP
ncbi:MAG: hypothetical protein LUQ29_03985, partial [Methylococcaceae bacterium]|nr:hypothetical protein [Methylococcaceae bacterium]